MERERDQLKEAFTKSQVENSRLNEGFRERLQDQEIKLKRHESERQRIDLDHTR